MSHTPGPWTCDFHRQGSDALGERSMLIVRSSNGESGIIARLFGINKIPDGNLIAAAPELLEACKGLIVQVEREGGAAMRFPPYKARFDALKAAIAKAEVQ